MAWDSFKQLLPWMNVLQKQCCKKLLQVEKHGCNRSTMLLGHCFKPGKVCSLGVLDRKLKNAKMNFERNE
jgi:hypothetical protein